MGFPILVLSMIAVVGGLIYRRRIRDYVGRRPGGLDDDMMRRIEEEGVLEVQEGIDIEEVRQEEERFWSETWDQPDEEW